MTSAVSIYHIPSDLIVNCPSQTPCCVNIIDTPGFGDTRGFQWDVQIKNMATQFLNKIKFLDYILFAVKSNDNRVSESNKYIFNEIKNLYANDISDRFIGMYTFSDGNEPSAK